MKKFWNSALRAVGRWVPGSRSETLVTGGESTSLSSASAITKGGKRRQSDIEFVGRTSRRHDRRPVSVRRRQEAANALAIEKSLKEQTMDSQDLEFAQVVDEKGREEDIDQSPPRTRPGPPRRGRKFRQSSLIAGRGEETGNEGDMYSGNSYEDRVEASDTREGAFLRGVAAGLSSSPDPPTRAPKSRSTTKNYTVNQYARANFYCLHFPKYYNYAVQMSSPITELPNTWYSASARTAKSTTDSNSMDDNTLSSNVGEGPDTSSSSIYGSPLLGKESYYWQRNPLMNLGNRGSKSGGGKRRQSLFGSRRSTASSSSQNTTGIDTVGLEDLVHPSTFTRPELSLAKKVKSVVNDLAQEWESLTPVEQAAYNKLAQLDAARFEVIIDSFPNTPAEVGSMIGSRALTHHLSHEVTLGTPAEEDVVNAENESSADDASREPQEALLDELADLVGNGGEIDLASATTIRSDAGGGLDASTGSRSGGSHRLRATALHQDAFGPTPFSVFTEEVISGRFKGGNSYTKLEEAVLSSVTSASAAAAATVSPSSTVPGEMFPAPGSTRGFSSDDVTSSGVGLDQEEEPWVSTEDEDEDNVMDSNILEGDGDEITTSEKTAGDSSNLDEMDRVDSAVEEEWPQDDELPVAQGGGGTFNAEEIAAASWVPRRDTSLSELSYVWRHALPREQTLHYVERALGERATGADEFEDALDVFARQQEVDEAEEYKSYSQKRSEWQQFLEEEAMTEGEDI